MSERKPAFWVVKRRDGMYWCVCGWRISSQEAVRYSSPESAMSGGFGVRVRVVPVYVKVTRVRRSKKLTEAQRNAVADYLELVAKQDHPWHLRECAELFRSGKAGL